MLFFFSFFENFTKILCSDEQLTKADKTFNFAMDFKLNQSEWKVCNDTGLTIWFK